jgi:hypothetical protein
VETELKQPQVSMEGTIGKKLTTASRFSESRGEVEE